MTRILCTALLAVVLAACGSSSSTAGGGTTPSGEMSGGAAATALAAKLGIGENYVTMALSAAQSMLGTGQKTPDEKAAAAQTGVDKAAAQAQADGKPLTTDQKTGLLEGLKGLL